MKAIDLDNKECDVLMLDAVKAFRIVTGLDTAITVDAGEFPGNGMVYVFQRPNEDDEVEKLQAAYQLLADEWEGDEGIPSLDEMLENEMLVLGKMPFALEVQDSTNVVMHFGRSEQEPREISIDDNGHMYDCSEEEPLEEMRKHWRDFIIPIPPPPAHASSELYLTMAYEPYDWIKSGEKTTEFREYTENWVKKILSHPIRTVRFQRGYGGPGKPAPEQMVWTVKRISLYEEETKMEGNPLDPPEGIIPTCIAIDLGERIQ